jgi:hypothetical protein
MRENRTSGSMRGCWGSRTVGLVRHRQTKGAATDRPGLPAGGQCSTLPCSGLVGRAAILLAQEQEPSSIRNGELLDCESRGRLRGGWLLFGLFVFCFLAPLFCRLLLTLVLILLAALVSHGVSPLLVRDIVLP